MTPETQGFTLRASASRLDKGLLAIPRKFRYLFPQERGPIQVVFDDETSTRTVSFQPLNATSKETRILGLARWYSKRRVREGDVISITLEPAKSPVYRIALERFLHEQRRLRARQRLRGAASEAEAQEQLAHLSQLARTRPRETAKEELLEIVRTSHRRPRPVVIQRPIEHREQVPPAVRVLLRELYSGKCQLCSFTFEKRNTEPYFEIHHLDPRIGHHPTNLLVVCPNCHAQLEHADVTNPRWAGDWLTELTINGKRVTVRQAFEEPYINEVMGRITVLLIAVQLGIIWLSRLNSRQP
jgi:5-methylcytosine-specific restriction endonuclease McrA